MAVLVDADRKALWAELMRRYSLDAQSIGVTKPDLRAAVDAMDQFLSDNASTINAAIPQPARGALTAPQKALLMVYVIQQRYLSGA